MKIVPLLLVVTLSSSAAFAEMYTWKDNKGTDHYTNSLHEIPARYLKKARVLDVATGKKGGPATEQQVMPTAPAPPSGLPQAAPSFPVAQPAPPVVPAPQPAPPAAAPPAAQADRSVANPPPSDGATVSTPRKRGSGESRRSRRRSTDE